MVVVRDTGEYFDDYEWDDGNLRIQFEGSDVFIRWGYTI